MPINLLPPPPEPVVNNPVPQRGIKLLPPPPPPIDNNINLPSENEGFGHKILRRFLSGPNEQELNGEKLLGTPESEGSIFPKAKQPTTFAGGFANSLYNDFVRPLGTPSGVMSSGIPKTYVNPELANAGMIKLLGKGEIKETPKQLEAGTRFYQGAEGVADTNQKYNIDLGLHKRAPEGTTVMPHEAGEINEIPAIQAAESGTTLGKLPEVKVKWQKNIVTGKFEKIKPKVKTYNEGKVQEVSAESKPYERGTPSEDIVLPKSKFGDWTPKDLGKALGEQRFPSTTKPVINDVTASPAGNEFQKLPQTSNPNIELPREDNFLKILKDNPKELLYAPRSIMSTADLSAPLRQGRTLAHKKEFWTSLDDMFKSAGSEEGFNKVQQSIESHPYFATAKESGLQLTDLTKKISTREEQFQSHLAEAIPGFGKLVRGSGRAYTGFLNKLRIDTFGSLLDNASKAGQDVTPELKKGLAEFVNTATGRGNLGRFEHSAVGMNQVFYSPRFIASRLRYLDPRTYITKNPGVRKEYLKSALATMASTAMIGKLTEIAGAKVSHAIISSDFGKSKFKNTRIDFSGGFQPYFTFLGRLAESKTTTGNGRTYGIRDKMGTISNFGRSKLAPNPATALDLITGRDITGQKTKISKEIIKLYTPMIAQDLYDIIKDDPSLTPAIIPGIFGAGVQTYQ